MLGLDSVQRNCDPTILFAVLCKVDVGATFLHQLLNQDFFIGTIGQENYITDIADELVNFQRRGEMYKTIISITIFVMLMGCSNPTSNYNVPQSIQTDFALLKTTDTFAGTEVGFAGSVPPQIPAFQMLLNHPEAKYIFAALQIYATLEGQTYALCGLYLTDKIKFDQVIGRYQNNQNKITTFFRCIMSEQPISDLTPDIINGIWPKAFENCINE